MAVLGGKSAPYVKTLLSHVETPCRESLSGHGLSHEKRDDREPAVFLAWISIPWREHQSNAPSENCAYCCYSDLGMEIAVAFTILPIPSQM